MGNKRKRNKKPKAKPKHSEGKQSSDERRMRPMTNVLIFVLPIAAGIVFAIAGMLYGTQKIPSIWLVCGGVVLCTVAACLHWQHVVETALDNPPFVVAIEKVLTAEKRDSGQTAGIYNQHFITPIPLWLYVRVVNNQDIPAKVSLFNVELELSPKRWVFPPTWLPTVQVPPDIALIWVNPAPNPPRRIDLIGSYLESTLRASPIAPHQTVEGWVLLDASSEYDSVPRPLIYRISVRDTAGQKLSTIDLGPGGDENLTAKSGFVSREKVDLTGMQLRHFADPPGN